MSRDISFGTVNLYNLQLPGEPTRQGATRFTPEQYQRRIAWFGARLREMDADVLAFQECWSRQSLLDVFAAAGLGETYTLHFIADRWYDIAVAAAVKKPWTVAATTLHKSFPDGFRLVKRGHGEAGADADRDDEEIDVRIGMFSRTVMQLSVKSAEPGMPVVEVFCCHLKSKLTTVLDRPERETPATQPHTAALGAALSTIRRTAEAAALRMLLNGVTRQTDRAAVVLGDLNDGVHSNTLAIVTAQPPYRRQARSRVGGASDQGFYAASQLQALSDFQDVAYTHVHKGVREQLDHVLVSEQFYDHSARRKWSFVDQRLWNDHLDDETDGNARASTDHGLVRSRFAWDPA